jgi:hypothetical protein
VDHRSGLRHRCNYSRFCHLPIKDEESVALYAECGCRGFLYSLFSYRRISGNGNELRQYNKKFCKCKKTRKEREKGSLQTFEAKQKSFLNEKEILLQEKLQKFLDENK